MFECLVCDFARIIRPSLLNLVKRTIFSLFLLNATRFASFFHLIIISSAALRSEIVCCLFSRLILFLVSEWPGRMYSAEEQFIFWLWNVGFSDRNVIVNNVGSSSVLSFSPILILNATDELLGN